MSSFNERGLELARAKLEPLKQLLERICRVIAVRYHERLQVEHQNVEEAAKNTYVSQYSLRCQSINKQDMLSFILTGDNSDLILLRDRRSNGEWEYDQRVFRLDAL